MNPYDVLLRPVISEKSNGIREKTGKYVFQIHMDASKEDVTKAMKVVFDVKAEKVQTMISRGKFRRRGQHYSHSPSRKKKAVVTLAEGQTLKIFEDQ